MAFTLASKIINRAALVLTDTANIRWSRDELLDWLNEGQRELVTYKPNAYTKTVTHQLVSGTRQTLPSDCNALVGVVRNMGIAGTTPGEAVRAIERGLLDSFLPGWHSAPASVTVKHAIYDEHNPKEFYVYPPQPLTPTRVELVYSAIPGDMAESDTLLVDDTMAPALLNYVLYRAYSKDTEYPTNAQRATAYYGAFTALLNGKASGEVSAQAKPEGV